MSNNRRMVADAWTRSTVQDNIVVVVVVSVTELNRTEISVLCVCVCVRIAHTTFSLERPRVVVVVDSVQMSVYL